MLHAQAGWWRHPPAGQDLAQRTGLPSPSSPHLRPGTQMMGMVKTATR